MQYILFILLIIIIKIGISKIINWWEQRDIELRIDKFMNSLSDKEKLEIFNSIDFKEYYQNLLESNYLDFDYNQHKVLKDYLVVNFYKYI